MSHYKYDEGFEAEDLLEFQEDKSNQANEKAPLQRRESYKDQDSVLHYFIATTQSEHLLDTYMSRLIHSFLNSNGPIYAYDIPLSPATLEVQEKKSLSTYLQDLKSNLISRATRTGAPQMIGHMSSALPYFHRPLARLLTTLNQNVVKVETASTFTALERNTLAMLHRVFFDQTKGFYQTYEQRSDTSLGMICSGGTVANISALWIARNKALPTVAKVGLPLALKLKGYERAIVLGSALMHYSFKKAVDLLGLGEDGLVLVDTDDQFRMR
jgi:glutamate decarboxylase